MTILGNVYISEDLWHLEAIGFPSPSLAMTLSAPCPDYSLATLAYLIIHEPSMEGDGSPVGLMRVHTAHPTVTSALPLL